MDSKLKRLSIIGCALVALLLIIVVVQLNGGISAITGKGKKPAPEPVTSQPADPGNEGFATGAVGDNLSAFLNDSTFFDPEKNEFLESIMDSSNRITISATSVEKDLRVQIIDNNGELVRGQSFIIRVSDAEGVKAEYRDLDQDGIIYVGSLNSGNYEVKLLPQEGYKVADNSITIRVKEKVEYIPIDDISLLIKTEAEIDAELEDSRVAEAAGAADKTEKVTLQFGGTRQKVGIDVSKYQGDIDWDKVAAAGVEFVIIRAGYRGSVTGALVEDPYFVTNLRGALAAGLEVGVYFFTQAISETEAVEEASAVISMVQGYDIKLPIYIDTEGAGGSGRADGLDVETRTLVCEAFCRTIVNAGYNGGVYASRYWLNNNLTMSSLDKYEVWLAEYTAVPKYTGYYTMWQHSSKGRIDGIEGNVDLDIYYY